MPDDDVPDDDVPDDDGGEEEGDKGEAADEDVEEEEEEGDGEERVMGLLEGGGPLGAARPTPPLPFGWLQPSPGPSPAPTTPDADDSPPKPAGHVSAVELGNDRVVNTAGSVDAVSPGPEGEIGSPASGGGAETAATPGAHIPAAAASPAAPLAISVESTPRAVVFKEPSHREARAGAKLLASWPPEPRLCVTWFWLPLLRYALSGEPCDWCVALSAKFPDFPAIARAYSHDFAVRQLRKGDVSVAIDSLTGHEVQALFQPGYTVAYIPPATARFLARLKLLAPCAVPAAVFSWTQAVARVPVTEAELRQGLNATLARYLAGKPAGPARPKRS